MVSACWPILGVFACTMPNPRFQPGPPGPDVAEVAPLDDAGVDGGGADGETGVRQDSQVDVQAIEATSLDANDAGDGQAADLLDAADAAPLPAAFAHWRLDEAAGSSTAADSAGTNPGTLSANAAFVTPGFPGTGFTNRGALALDGNSHVVLGATGLARLEEPTTISLWYFIPAATLPLVNRKNLLVLSSLSPRQALLQIGIQNGYATAWRSSSSPIFVSSPTLVAGWHHMAYTSDGTGQSLYLEGVLHRTVPTPPPSAAVTAAYLGAYDPAQSGERFTGQIDDVRIYKRVLDAAQISALASGAP
jgi:hypothetical protein